MGAAYVPTLELLSEGEVSGEVRQIFDEIKDFFNVDFVPQMYRALAHDPKRLRQVFDMQKELYECKLGIDPKIFEILGLAVATTRSCPYCINYHTTLLKAMGMSDAEIEALVSLIGLSNDLVTYTIGLQLTPDITPELAERLSKSRAVRGEEKVEVKASM